MRTAFGREKQIKGWLRRKKIALIEAMNPQWIDLSDGWLQNVNCHSEWVSRSPEPFAPCHSEGVKRPKNLAQDKLREGEAE